MAVTPPGTPQVGKDVSGSTAPPAVPRFNNGWTKEQEELMAGWSDIGACYRWMHDRYEKVMSRSNMWITVPVIVLSTLTGSASFLMNSLAGNNQDAQKYAQIGIGGVSIFTGILTTLGNFFRFAQNSESNRVASISWGKFQRQIAVELALHPRERIDCMDFLKITRSELDRLIEQSPPIPDAIIDEFEKEFASTPALKRPDIAHGIDHTHIFRDNDSRMKQLVVDATIMMKQKKKIWHESLLPEVNKHVNTALDKHLKDLSGSVLEFEKRIKAIELQASKVRNDSIARNPYVPLPGSSWYAKTGESLTPKPSSSAVKSESPGVKTDTPASQLISALVSDVSGSSIHATEDEIGKTFTT
jgi:hypothetical protein